MAPPKGLYPIPTFGAGFGPKKWLVPPSRRVASGGRDDRRLLKAQRSSRPHSAAENASNDLLMTTDSRDLRRDRCQRERCAMFALSPVASSPDSQGSASFHSQVITSSSRWSTARHLLAVLDPNMGRCARRLQQSWRPLRSRSARQSCSRATQVPPWRRARLRQPRSPPCR